MLPSPALPPWDAIAPSSSSSPSSPSSWRPTPVISPTTESCMDAAAWVAGWQLTAALDPVTTVRYLLYLGAAKAPEVRMCSCWECVGCVAGDVTPYSPTPLN